MSQHKSAPFTLASVYLAVGLGACFLVLTRMVPSFASLAERAPESGSWHEFALELSRWACAHQLVLGSAFLAIAVGGFILPVLVRSARNLVWLAAVAVFVLDLALAAGSWWNAVDGVLKAINQTEH